MLIQTSNLNIRPYRQDDARQLCDALKASRAELLQWMPWAQIPPSMKQARSTIRMFKEQMASGKEFPLALFLKDDTFVGSSGYRVTNSYVPSFEIGYWLDTRWTKRGLMWEAVMAQTSYLFTQLKAQRVTIECHEDNHASAKVAFNTGFKQEVLLKNHRRHVDGTLANTRLFAHTPDTWSKFDKSI